MARYFRRGTTKIYFVPGETTITDVDAPTAAQINGTGVELSCDIAEISGFSFTNSPISVPDMCATFVKKIPGEDTAADSTMKFYEDNTSNPLFTTLAKGTLGFVVFFPYGLATTSPSAGDDCEVWPVSVASNTREWNAGNEAAKYDVTFTLIDVPGLNTQVV